MKKCLLLLVVLCCTLASSAYTFVVDGVTYFYSIGATNCVVSSVPSDLEGVFTVPRYVDYKNKTYKVNGIKSGAFRGCASLTGVILHDGITSIESSAFRNCTALESINIPGSVKSCGNYAFAECSSLAVVTLGEGVETLGNYIFDSCKSLERIDIPEGCTKMGQYSFYLCGALKEVHLPSTLTVIPYGLFSVCTSLEELTIPAGVMGIGEYAFASCGSLRSINVDPANPYYASHDGVVFDKEMKAIVIYPPGRTDATYTTPQGVEDINPTAFLGNDKLQHLVLSEGVKNLYANAIVGDTCLVSVSLPASLENFDDNAISSCDKISEIHVSEANPHYMLVDGVLFTRDMKRLVFLPSMLQIAHYDVPDGVESFNGSAIVLNFNLKSLNMPPSVTSMGENFCYICTELSEVVLSPNITVIPQAAFNGCFSLEQITLPDGVTEIGGFAFSACPLKSIVLPAKVKKIGRYAFECEELSDVYSYAPEPPELANYAFYETFPTVHVPKGLADVYAEAKGWSELRIVDDLEAPEGIANVVLDATSAAPAVAYDLLGRRIQRATSQPRIEQGRKVKN